MKTSEVKEKIVLAVDVDDMNYAIKLIEELKDFVGVFKFGLQFYTNNGNKITDIIQKYNLNCFLDIKLHDIPNTVSRAAANIICQQKNLTVKKNIKEGKWLVIRRNSFLLRK